MSGITGDSAMTFEHWQWFVMTALPILGGGVGWWVKQKAENRAAKKAAEIQRRIDEEAARRSLSDDEQAFRQEMRTELAAAKAEAQACHAQRDEDREVARKQRREDQKRFDEEIDGLRKTMRDLHSQNTKQQLELDEKTIQLSDLRKHKAITFDIPGGRRASDPVSPPPPGPLGMPLPPNATFDLRVSTAPPGESTTITPGVTPGHPSS